VTGAIDNLLSSLGPVAVLAVMAIVFAESGLLAGFFLPGDSLLFATGLLTASGVLGVPIAVVVVLVTVAAVAGDQVGYLIGRRYGPRLLSRPRSRLLTPAHLGRAATFFDRYGRPAVVLARFVPVARTFTPVAAGAAHMPRLTFTGFNVIGATLWCTSMLTAGYLLGGVPFVHRHIELITLGIVAASLVPGGISVLRSRFGRPSPPRLLSLAAVGGTSAAGALAVAVTRGNWPATWDPPLHATVVAHRTTHLTTAAQAVSFVGSETVLAALSVLLAVVLLLARRRRDALVVAAGMAGAALLIVGIKHLVGRARPGATDVIGPVEHSYSFPSGHTLGTAILAGLVVWVLRGHLTSTARRTGACAAAALVSCSVGASRVYLGYHWPTDVVTGLLVAGAWLAALALLTRLPGAGEEPRGVKRLDRYGGGADQQEVGDDVPDRRSVLEAMARPGPATTTRGSWGWAPSTKSPSGENTFRQCRAATGSGSSPTRASRP
jgi:membrane-associated protein